MNKLLLTLFWLISLLIMFFIGKNTGAGDLSVATKAQLNSAKNLAEPALYEIEKCDTTLTDENKILTSSEQATNNQASKSNQTNAQHTLIKELADVKRQLKEAESKLESIYATESNVSRQAEQPSQVSEEEVVQHLSAPFDSVILNARGSMVDKFRQLHEESEDHEWSIIMEQHISDFFVTHDFANKVKLDAVTCKQTICEIRGFEFENEAWGRVMSDMRNQSWWNFVSSHSTTQNNKEFGMYFYSLISKTVI